MRIHKTLFIFGLGLIFLLGTPGKTKAGIIVLNGLTHLHDVQPGETYKGVIKVQNTAQKDQAVRLYLRDYFFRHTGETFYEEPGKQSRSNASWIELSPEYLVLQPKEKASIAYQITVPENAPQVGTYWSVIMVEGENPVDENSLGKGINVQTKVRYAIQISTTLPGAGKRNLTFYDAKLVKEKDDFFLLVDLENKGDFLFKPEVSVELFDENGSTVGTFTAEKKKIYPETSARFQIMLEEVKPGNYQALILADGGGEDVFGINLELEIEDD